MKRFLCAWLFVLVMQLSASDYTFTGVHYMASYKDCDHEALVRLEALQEAMKDSVAACGATLLAESHFVFPPDGLTMVLLLSESHASIHTYPEYDACYVDLFTCGESCDYRKFEIALSQYLKPGMIDSQVMAR